MKLSSSEPDIRTIIGRIEDRDIILQPEFQRQEVWSTAKKRKLIDTVLRGWSIPPIHLVEVGDNRAEVLDGQQRLASLRDFFNNRFTIDGRITPEDPRVLELHGKYYRDLDPPTRRAIDQFPIRCFRITDYKPGEPSELFYRLNQPTVLTPGEQRNALFGPARNQMKKLVESFEGAGNDQSTIGFSNNRLAYDDVFARLLFMLENKDFGIKSTESRLAERFRSGEPFSAETVSRVERAIFHFSNDRVASDPYRFNKATALSWLLFFSRFPEGHKPRSRYLQMYIEVSQKRTVRDFVSDAAAVFEDRSSLRVTDVTSVLYRDFCLFYIYLFVANDYLPPIVPQELIVDVRKTTEKESSFEAALVKTIGVKNWSPSL